MFDRGEKGSLVRLLQRRHLHDIQQIEHPADRRMASLLDWVLGSACADHDVQNGLCNSCSFGHADSSIMYTNIFKAVRSARDTLDKLMESLLQWLRQLDMTDEAFEIAEVKSC